uniref:MGAT4 family member D n=1 Tax=Oryctolagus cuniculus TaxID=9986 RepID=A0A5F9D346_RABIT
MRSKRVNLLICLIAFVLFTFSCFCISRMTQISNQLTNCRNHMSEFKETMQHLKNRAENSRQELMEAFNQMKNDITNREKVSGSLGKLFRSEDLTDLVRFFLMFYKDKPIDSLLSEIFHLKMCDTRKHPVTCKQRKKQICVRHNPSLFQHVGIHSSLLGKEQYFKKI